MLLKILGVLRQVAIAGIIIGLAYYFMSILLYILIAGVVALIGRPLVRKMANLKFGKNYSLPTWFCALTTLLLFYVIISLTVFAIVPPLIEEVQHLSSIKPEAVVGFFKELIQNNFYGVIQRFNVDIERELNNYLAHLLKSVFNQSFFTGLVSVASGLGDTMIGIFSVSFIAFFFLKDGELLPNALFYLTPTRYIRPTLRVVDDMKRLLRRYFLGILLQTSAIAILYLVALTLLGVKNALLIAFFAGAVNTIPYIGPLFGYAFAILVAISTNVNGGVEVIMPLLPKVTIVAGSIKLIDDFILQPLIYANSVKAHPLEIFLIILIGGKLGGIPGMILALPLYTVLRVIAKEFFPQNKIIKVLTQNL